MTIEIIDTLGQKNNGEFPIVDSNDIKGGFYQVGTLEKRNSIPLIRRKIGMLCSVEEENITYQLLGGIENINWGVFKGSSDTGCDVTKEYVDGELSTKSPLEHKHDSLYPPIDSVYSTEIVDKKLTELEENINNIPIGDTPPITDDIVWIDTSDIEESNPITDDILMEIKSVIFNLQSQINDLKTKNLELESRVTYLEIYGGGGSTTPGTDTILTLEDGTILTLEDGSILSLENSNSNDTLLTTENGELMTFEDNSILILE